MRHRFLSFFLVLLLLISPGPLGLRPAHAILPAVGLALIEQVAIGAVVATGTEFASAAYDYYKTGGAPVQDYYAPTSGTKYADSYNANGSTASVDTTKKTINRPVQAIKTFPPATPTGKAYSFGKSTAIGVGIAALSGWIAAHPSSAPITKQAIDSASTPVLMTSAPQVNDVFDYGTGNKKINAYGSYLPDRGAMYESSVYPNVSSVINRLCALSSGTTFNIGGGRIVVIGSPTYYKTNFREDFSSQVNGYPLVRYDQYNITYIPTSDPITPVPQVNIDYQNLSNAINGLSGVVAELDTAIRANLSPAAVAVPKLTQTEIDQAAAKTAELQSQDRADTLKAQLASDPTNTTLQVAADSAQAEADKYKLDYERQFESLDDQDPQEPEPEMIPPPVGPEPDIDLEIDLTPLLTLQDKAMGKFPFSAVSSLGSIFSGLTADPVTPSMDMPMPWGLPPAKISLSKWDDFAVKWRFLIAMMFHASCIYAIVRRYS